MCVLYGIFVCLCKYRIDSKMNGMMHWVTQWTCFVLIRMENSVLGNALEGVPEESEEEEQPGNSNIESANNLDG